MAIDWFASFSTQIARLERTRSRAETAFTEGRIIRADAETVYESLFLRATIYFEEFLEELFCAILLDKISYPRGRVVRTVEFGSRQNLNRVLWGAEDYLKWLPYNETKKRAMIWLRAGRPFTELDDGQLSRLKRLFVIRNAIAHSSDHAKQKFLAEVVASQNLLSREKTPAGYLRSVYILNPRTTRFEEATEDLRIVAQALLPKSIPRRKSRRAASAPPSSTTPTP